MEKINLSACLFWNVDTQFDFVEPAGKLYVSGAEKLKPTWKALTELAAKKAIKVVNTADFHLSNSLELSAAPNFIDTFPEHCMAGTTGAEFIAETKPANPLVFEWDRKYNISDYKKNETSNIVIHKDAFDVFRGNQNTDEIVRMLAPETVIVYGVTTNVCVNNAVVGLAARVKHVIVVFDAIKELPGIPLPFIHWQKLGVQMVTFDELTTLL